MLRFFAKAATYCGPAGTMALTPGMYSLRRRMRLVQDAILAQAPEVQRSILEAVADRTAADRRAAPPQSPKMAQPVGHVLYLDTVEHRHARPGT